jgi:hypothetical protein
VEVWDAQTGQELRAHQGHTGMVQRVCFSPDGRRLASASMDQTVKVWDVQMGQKPLIPQRHIGDQYGQRLVDPLRAHLWHLQLAREARAGGDAFALVFHLEPLLLTSFTGRGARPRDAFPLWAGRPPMSRTPSGTGEGPVPLTAAEVQRLHDALTRRLDAEPKAWQV